jgi:hypothetical protein
MSKNISIPIGLTIVVILLGILIFEYFPLSYCATIGTVVGGIGSIIAVIWFYTSLQFQREQLEEQRKQFISEFQQIREDGRRNALILSRDILNETEKRISRMNPELKDISDLVPLYLQFSELKPIFEETNPSQVKQYIQDWLKKEGPAVVLMKGIKSAAEIYFRVLNLEGIDFTKDAEEFVYIYGLHLWKLPFFDVYQPTATMLAEFMIKLSPGRKSVILASMVVASMLAPKGVMRDDKIREDIENHRKKGYPLPKIVEIYLKR